MALDPMARRQHGVSAPDYSGMESNLMDAGTSDAYDGVKLPVSTYRNPGPTPNMRDMEPNTSWDRSASESEPMFTQTFGSEVPRSEVFNAPDSSDLNASHGGGYDNPDAGAKFQMEVNVPHDSFSAMNESYPANGGRDGST